MALLLILDLARLRQGRQLIYREEMGRYVAWGDPIAPSKMIARITASLGSENTTTTTILTRYCSF